MTQEEVWIPLVDEPIGALVSRLQEADPELTRLVSSPRQLLAFRTFAYIRVGILLGRLLVEDELERYDGGETWVDALLQEPAHREKILRELRAVAAEVASGAGDDGAGVPDDGARERFRAFARGLR